MRENVWVCMRQKGIFCKELAVCVYIQIHVYGCRQRDIFCKGLAQVLVQGKQVPWCAWRASKLEPRRANGAVLLRLVGWRQELLMCQPGLKARKG